MCIKVLICPIKQPVIDLRYNCHFIAFSHDAIFNCVFESHQVNSCWPPPLQPWPDPACVGPPGPPGPPGPRGANGGRGYRVSNCSCALSASMVRCFKLAAASPPSQGSDGFQGERGLRGPQVSFLLPRRLRQPVTAWLLLTACRALPGNLGTPGLRAPRETKELSDTMVNVDTKALVERR